MNKNKTRAVNCDVRIRGMGFTLPGSPIDLLSLDLTSNLRKRLDETGQEFTYSSKLNSTDLAISAAREAMNNADVNADDIGLIISAPTLLTSYGLEIPAISIQAALGLEQADCLNLSQGCVGLLAAIRLAGLFLKCELDGGNVLIVTACQASSLIDNFSHGAFFWGDGAGAIVVTSQPGKGLHAAAYAEKSSNVNWGAMRLRYGDGMHYSDCIPERDLKIDVAFSDMRAQANYIMGEQDRCSAIIEALLCSANIAETDIDGLFFPSIGKNRVPTLLVNHRSLKPIVKSDFRQAHLGGVDVMLFLNQHLNDHPPAQKSWYLALTPAFTAQWGGILFRYDA
jgi:3-oxoacyl-[acyl-carrier-protein] synthase III